MKCNINQKVPLLLQKLWMENQLKHKEIHFVQEQIWKQSSNSWGELKSTNIASQLQPERKQNAKVSSGPLHALFIKVSPVHKLTLNIGAISID